MCDVLFFLNRCQTEKLCYPNDPIGQRINPVRVGLIGLCSEGCDTELLYEWQVFGVDSEGNETYLAEASEFLVGMLIPNSDLKYSCFSFL